LAFFPPRTAVVLHPLESSLLEIQFRVRVLGLVIGYFFFEAAGQLFPAYFPFSAADGDPHSTPSSPRNVVLVVRFEPQWREDWFFPGNDRSSDFFFFHFSNFAPSHRFWRKRYAGCPSKLTLVFVLPFSTTPFVVLPRRQVFPRVPFFSCFYRVITGVIFCTSFTQGG